ncbi:MAG: phosphoserine phosphatase SerB [Gammaproteobacteria bacterium]|nr:phosphoserine phosphatase SerB [Gammaproteobacteria bacterium]
MYKIILQGPRLSAELGQQLALELDARIDFKRGFAVVHLANAPSQSRLQALRAHYPFDINLLPRGFDGSQVKLVISDMDSTLISIECIDEIADFANVKPQVSAITEAAMRGELDFEGSLTRRVALLAGLSTDVLQTVYDDRLKLNPGAELMLSGLRRQQIKFALVSGGFTFFTDRLKQRLKLDYSRANVLEKVDGKLTGKVLGKIIGAEAKEEFLQELCLQMGISRSQVLAVGDGANDLKMLSVAGIGVAYYAKPKVQEQADAVINHAGLEGLLGLLEIEH